MDYNWTWIKKFLLFWFVKLLYDGVEFHLVVNTIILEREICTCIPSIIFSYILHKLFRSSMTSRDITISKIDVLEHATTEEKVIYKHKLTLCAWEFIALSKLVILEKWENFIQSVGIMLYIQFLQDTMSLLQPTSNSVELCRNYEYVMYVHSMNFKRL